MLEEIPEASTLEEQIDRWLAHDDTIARCPQTGAKLKQSRKQWTLVYENRQRGMVETRHWSRAKVPRSQILERAQRSLDKMLQTVQQTEQ